MKIKRKKINKSMWHSKFAWWFTKVDDSDDFDTRIIFERYWQKDPDSAFVKRYSEKEYFKRKLEGSLDGIKVSGEDCAPVAQSAGQGPAIKASNKNVEILKDAIRHNKL